MIPELERIAQDVTSRIVVPEDRKVVRTYVDSVIKDILQIVAEKIRSGDIEEHTPQTGYDRSDPQDCLRAQAHSMVLSLLED